MSRIKIGKQVLNFSDAHPEGAFVKIEGQEFYRISKVDQMPPFFMTLVSPFDHWMFISSNGGLTAGRKDADHSLFPYYTDDKLVDNAEFTGPKTLIRLRDPEDSDAAYLWEPFSDRQKGLYNCERNLYKSLSAEQLIFEELNSDLQLRFRYSWGFSEKFGFVRKVSLKNMASEERELECLDGLQNILPSNVDGLMQDRRSTLVDAYKKNELDQDSGMGIYSLSSNIVDKAEPSESLSANVVWSPDKADFHLLSDFQLDQFRRGSSLKGESFSKAVKGAWFTMRNHQLAALAEDSWYLIAETALSSAAVHDLKALISRDTGHQELEAELQKTKKELESLVAQADGLQLSQEKLVQTRHYGNVLYNIMRGGIFEDSYAVDIEDFKVYLNLSNSKLSNQFAKDLEQLQGVISYSALQEWLEEKANADLRRLGAEYLPLSFSRRHGDPSRPWNRFSITRLDAQGAKILNYEGNWRDIFQNWEALAYSYPRFIEGMIFKFLNASTIDGYNPYRIAKNGIDWELIEPHDPWSFIGYWGDHQIIYLLRLLEHSEKHYPGLLKKLNQEFSFVYADVPYRLKSHREIMEDPQDTIEFNDELNRNAEKRYEEYGTDGKLIWKDGDPLRANLAEKLLLTALTKLYNLVPDGGIWMNTQRPEWNDANNALVGNGLSMVTLSYLRRYLRFLESWLSTQEEDLHVNAALLDLILSVSDVLRQHQAYSEMTSQERLEFMNKMGEAGERYRRKAYTLDLGANQALGVIETREFCARTIRFLDRSIENNEKENGLYHAYNLLKLEDSEAKIEYLYEMLEGQVAVLTSETLSPEKALAVLDGLKKSAMYREDQYSYMLYPDRQLAAFLEKNRISPAEVEGKELKDELLERDFQGHYHFKAHHANAKELNADLEALASAGQEEAVKAETDFWLALYEDKFIHRAFTGRSGTFYGYEGLGSIYWHMVSKLLLAVQENLIGARKRGANPAIIGRLIDHYYEIRAGIGVNKSPDLYGAFPFDAYSHTPSTAGAQQPGMTGQVKEDVLNRWAELGLQVAKGQLQIDPFFLSEQEFLKEPQTFRYLNLHGNWSEINLEQGELAFTYCGVPFVYRKKGQALLRILKEGGETHQQNSLIMDSDHSTALFARSGSILQIEVDLP